MAKRHLNHVGDLESLFLRMEELVLANSGEDEFEEVFKLLIAKIWDEHAKSGQFQVHQNEKRTADAISSLLTNAVRAWPGILDEPKSRLTPEHLQVCVEALGKHTIFNQGLEVMDGFFEFMVAKAAKGSKGQYFTPRHVVELCVRMLNPQPEESVLDPACGSGGFLVHVLDHVRRNNPSTTITNYCASKLWGFDIDDRAIRVAKALMILAGDGSTNLIRLNSLLQPADVGLFGDEPVLTIEDICRSRMRNHRGFDVILTNPPFAGEVREKQLLRGYDVASDKYRVERDVLFVERCVRLLRPGGRMAIVLPHNKFASSGFCFLRDWIFRKSRVLAVVGLGRNTFLPHTHQKASVLFLKKHEEGAKPVAHDYKIFFSISERDGKNSKGQFLTRENGTGAIWDRVDHDLGEIEHGFTAFRKKEGIEV